MSEIEQLVTDLFVGLFEQYLANPSPEILERIKNLTAAYFVYEYCKGLKK